MNLDRLRPFLPLSCLLLGVSLPAHALDLVPFAGLRFGGSLSSEGSTESNSYSINASDSYGGVIDVPLGKDNPRALELYYSRQLTSLGDGYTLTPPIHDVEVSVLHLGLVDSWPAADPRMAWLLIGTAGATRLEAGGEEETRPSLGLGGGVRWMANEHFGFRADIRAILTFNGNSTGAIVCGGGCTLAYHGSVAAQGEASAGVVVRF
jgi:hypothetical protein